MTSEVETGLSTALGQRIRAVARVLLDGDDIIDIGSTAGWDELSGLLYRLVAEVKGDLTPARVWLLYSAIATAMPDSDDVREAVRTFELSTIDEAMHWLLESCLGSALDFGNAELEVQIVQDAVIVEVDFSARFNLHTGIQRVARALLPRWHRDRDITPVAWTPGYGFTRTLAADEADRVLRWHGGRGNERNTSKTALDTEAWSLVLPWNSVIVLTEVPSKQVSERLAALAEFSGNRLVGIGYDCIPVVSADLVPPAEPNRFVRYLSIVKHMHRIAGISVSATDEFQGFAHALRAQGITGPEVFECRLPSEMITGETTDDSSGADDESDRGRDREAQPTILCVGSHEPRKNQEAVLFAAESLWRQGYRFEVKLIGGTGWGTGFNRLVKQLRRRGRSVSVSRAVSDAELEHAYRAARFSVFASLHEGYGLPVAESLAFNLPVITSNYGSTAEIGASGGAILIDPRNDEELTNAMRTLLTDDEMLAKLRAQTTNGTNRTWDDYGDELWMRLVEPELASES